MDEKRDRRRCAGRGKDAGDEHVAADVALEKALAFTADLLDARYGGINEKCKGVKQEKQKMEHDLFPGERSRSLLFCLFSVGALGQLYLVRKNAAAFNHSCIVALHNNLRSVAVGDLNEWRGQYRTRFDLFRPSGRISFSL